MTVRQHLGDHWGRWGLVCSLTLILLLVGGASYVAVQTSQRAAGYLTNEGLPGFGLIQKLRGELATIESSIYAYYVTVDHDAFLHKYATSKAQSNQVIDALYRKFPEAHELTAISSLMNQLHSNTSRFRQIMSSSTVDWDKARALLAEFSPIADSLYKENESLSSRISDHISQTAQESLIRLQITVGWLAAFIIVGLLAIGVLARFNTHRLYALREKSRLTSFPESSPFPILSLDATGELIYSNPASIKLTAEIFNQSDPEQLLPSDICTHLIENNQLHEWEFEKSGRDFHIALHWLYEHLEYHVYISDISSRKKAERHLKYLAYHDELTGLPNRSRLFAYLKSQSSKGFPSLSCVCLLYVDRIQQALTTAGQEVADKVIVASANRLMESLKYLTGLSYQSLYRLDSSLFALTIGNKCTVEKVFTGMSTAMKASFHVEGHEFYLGLKAGCVWLEKGDKSSPDEILRKAETALGQGQKQGGDRLTYYQVALDEAHRERIIIENGLRHAIERREFELYYQPKLCINTGEVIGSEALLRWQTQDKGFISPGAFIPVAEDSGLITSIGAWVLRQACSDAQRWRASCGLDVSVAVNISAKQLLHGNLFDLVKEELNLARLPADWLELEITESTALTDYTAVVKILSDLRCFGVKLSLDDFGTGFSSLSYLHQLPVDTLKIDQSFIKNMTTKSPDHTIVHSIISLAHSVGLNVIAEGVETKVQLQQLNRLQCDQIQGYLLGAPMPFDEFVSFCQSHREAQWAVMPAKAAL